MGTHTENILKIIIRNNRDGVNSWKLVLDTVEFEGYMELFERRLIKFEAIRIYMTATYARWIVNVRITHTDAGKLYFL